MVEYISCFVGTDMAVDEKNLLPLNFGITLLQTDLSFPDGFDLASQQGNACFETLQPFVVEKRLFICCNNLHSVLPAFELHPLGHKKVGLAWKSPMVCFNAAPHNQTDHNSYSGPSFPEQGFEGDEREKSETEEEAFFRYQDSMRACTFLKQVESVSSIFFSTSPLEDASTSEISMTRRSLALSIIFFSRKERGLIRFR